MTEPTIGRIVIYKTRTSGEGDWCNNAEFLPAIITRVWTSTCVNLKIINDGPCDSWRTAVTLDAADAPQQGHTWRWPERGVE